MRFVITHIMQSPFLHLDQSILTKICFSPVSSVALRSSHCGWLCVCLFGWDQHSAAFCGNGSEMRIHHLGPVPGRGLHTHPLRKPLCALPQMAEAHDIQTGISNNVICPHGDRQ